MEMGATPIRNPPLSSTTDFYTTTAQLLVAWKLAKLGLVNQSLHQTPEVGAYLKNM